MRSWLLIALLLITFSSKCLCKDRRTVEREKPAVLTVCEVLEQRHRFHDKIVALVGVLGSTSEGSWLSDDGCSKRITTKGYTWDNDIWLEWASTAAPDPSGLLLADETELIRKLDLVKQRNKLRQFRSEGSSSRRAILDYSDRLTVVYGQFQSSKNLRPPRRKEGRGDWGNGYGHLNGSPAQILIKNGSIKYY